MTELGYELESTVAALADSYDQLVFLQQTTHHAVQASDPEGLLGVLEQARRQIGCGGGAVYAGGRWLGAAPEWLAAYPAPARRTQHPAHGLLALPIPQGWVALWGKPAYSAQDLRTAGSVAELIGAGLEALEAQQLRQQARLEEHERQLAARLWRQLVPAELAAPPGYRLWCLSQPAREVGGDFQCASGDWRALGDVSGKGLPAALFTGILTALLPLALRGEDPAQALEHSVAAQLEASGMFATLLAQRLGPGGRVRYFSLGHPPLLVRRLDGRVERLGATSPPLGLFAPPSQRYPEYALRPGEYAVAYTDGLYEAGRAGELFGLERLEALVAAHPEPHRLLGAAQAALCGWEIDDDLSLQIAQYQGAAQPLGQGAP